jgi:hypothetical protein
MHRHKHTQDCFNQFFSHSTKPSKENQSGLSSQTRSAQNSQVSLWPILPVNQRISNPPNKSAPSTTIDPEVKAASERYQSALEEDGFIPPSEASVGFVYEGIRY